MVELFSDIYQYPLFVVNDKETRAEVKKVYKKYYTEVRIGFISSKEFLKCWADDSSMLKQHDVIISLCPEVPELREVGDLIQVWFPVE